MRKGAELMPELQREEIHGFYEITGKGFADAWIRREILDYFSGRVEGVGVVFLTCDVANSLAAQPKAFQAFFSPQRKRTHS